MIVTYTNTEILLFLSFLLNGSQLHPLLQETSVNTLNLPSMSSEEHNLASVSEVCIPC